MRSFWLASLALHGLLLLGLSAWQQGLPLSGQPRELSPAQRQQVNDSLQRARRQQMQRQLAELERVRREIGAEALPEVEPRQLSEAQLRQRAQQIAQRIQAKAEQRRAEQLAKLAKLPPAEALRRVRADVRHAPPPPDASLSTLAQDARQRLALDRQQGAGGQGQGSGSSAGGAGSGGPGDRAVVGAGETTEARQYETQIGSPDPLPPQRLVEGRVLGPGGAPATRVLLDRWYVLGPFDGRSRYALNEALPPEQAVDLDGVYEGKQGLLVSWRLQTAPPYPLVPEPRHANAVYYAATELMSATEQTVWLELGVDDDAKLWLNDTLVWQSAVTADKPWYRQPWYVLHTRIAQRNLTEARVPVRLQAGRNTVLLKLWNGADLAFFSVVVARP